jgi:hypothetical protein
MDDRVRRATRACRTMEHELTLRTGADRATPPAVLPDNLTLFHSSSFWMSTGACAAPPASCANCIDAEGMVATQGKVVDATLTCGNLLHAMLRLQSNGYAVFQEGSTMVSGRQIITGRLWAPGSAICQEVTRQTKPLIVMKVAE